MLPKATEDEKPSKKMSSHTPFLINYNDEIDRRLKGVFEENSHKITKKNPKPLFDPIQVETEMLKKSIWTVFTGLPYVSGKVAKERAARLQELLHFCSSAETTNAGLSLTKKSLNLNNPPFKGILFLDVDRALKQFVFETMNLTEVNKRNSIRRNEQNVIIPWDDPYPNISATLSEEQQIFLKNLNILEAKKGE